MEDQEMIPAGWWACLAQCGDWLYGGLEDCYWWERQTVLLQHTDRKHQAFRVPYSEWVLCMNAFRMGNSMSSLPRNLTHAHISHSLLGSYPCRRSLSFADTFVSTISALEHQRLMHDSKENGKVCPCHWNTRVWSCHIVINRPVL